MFVMESAIMTLFRITEVVLYKFFVVTTLSSADYSLSDFH